MKNFWYIVNKVINDADVILLVLDSRLVEETRNREIESKVKRLNKPLVYVITKSDLVEKEKSEEHKKKIKPSVFVSAKEKYGTTLLRNKILIEAKKVGIKGMVKVGVLGYPNVGKSSLINAMKGEKAARTSIMSGYTKSLQKIRADNRIILIDTPGVIPYEEKDDMAHAMIGTIDFSKAKEPDLVVIELMERFPGRIEHHYGVDVLEDKEVSIENIAVKRKILKKGGFSDITRCAAMILKDWQKGAIK